MRSILSEVELQVSLAWQSAFKNALWLAEADSAELVQVISIHTPFVQARAG